MFEKDVMERLREAHARYEAELEEILSQVPGGDKKGYLTFSGLDVKPLYTPADLEGTDFFRDISFPGHYPYTRGVFPGGYLSRGLHIRQVTGLGTA
ncbi:MAG: methylmalonyl-CoA mutase family protein, partial [Thermodesulfobacteriota bacterium]